MEQIGEIGDVTQELSERCIAEIRVAFSMIDQDGDDRISVGELSQAMTSLCGLPPTDEELHLIMTRLDINESGFVEFEEFSVFMADFLRITGTNELIELREAFRFFDKDGDSRIDVDEIKCLLVQIGEELSDQQIDSLLEANDLDGDGKLSFEEFQRVMTI